MTIGDTLTKDGWRYDGEKDFWAHPKRQGHIKITIQGWVHKVTVSVAAGGCDEVDIKARDDYRTVKEGFNETDLQEHLNSLQSLGKYAGRMAVYGESTKTAILKSVTGILKFVGFASALLFILYWLGVWLTPEKQRLAEKYQISQDAVSIAPKPHGCDFEDAPLGNKHCHYERKEDPVRNEQQKVIAVYVTWDKVEE